MPTVYKVTNGFLDGSAEVEEKQPAPPGYTFAAPPALSTGQAAKFVGGKWRIVSVSDRDAAFAQAKLATDEDRAQAHDRIDLGADAARRKYITVIAGQEATYMRKEQEARDVQAGGTGPHPYLDAEATSLGITKAALAAEVIAAADRWDAVNARVEATRRSNRVRVNAAETKAEIDALFPIDWEG